MIINEQLTFNNEQSEITFCNKSECKDVIFALCNFAFLRATRSAVREISVAIVLMFLCFNVFMIAIGIHPEPVPTSISVVCCFSLVARILSSAVSTVNSVSGRGINTFLFTKKFRPKNSFCPNLFLFSKSKSAKHSHSRKK